MGFRTARRAKVPGNLWS